MIGLERQNCLEIGFTVNIFTYLIFVHLNSQLSKSEIVGLAVVVVNNGNGGSGQIKGRSMQSFTHLYHSLPYLRSRGFLF